MNRSSVFFFRSVKPENRYLGANNAASLRAGLILLVFFLFVVPAESGIIFSELDLSQDNRLLFKAGILNQEALFITTLPERPTLPVQTGPRMDISGTPSLRLLSAFPEKMEFLDNGRILQISNSFGTARLSPSGGLPAPVLGLPSFEGGVLASGSRAAEAITSPDGRWVLFLNAVSPALGDLVLLDLQTGVKTLISSRLDRPEKIFPAAWSPDSRFFLYEREGKLFFYMAGSSFMPADEKLRLVGDGKINSISWGQSRNGVSGGGGDFFYLHGSTLYQIRGPELFARTLYSDFLSVGIVAGKIPFDFDPAFDDFWLAPDARSILVSKGRRSLFFFPFDADAAYETVLPYLALPRSCLEINVLWPPDGDLAVFVTLRENGASRLNAWKLSRRAVFEPLALPPGGSYLYGQISPDGRLALVWGKGGILLYDFAKWGLLQTISGRPGISCLWKNSDSFVVADDLRIDMITLVRTGEASQTRTEIAGRELICLPRIIQARFEENSSRILAKNGDAWFVTDGRNRWDPISNPKPRNISQVSDRYRVYLENQKSGVYDNLAMIRNITSVGTFSLFPVRQAAETSGSGKRALYFDLYDDDWGLPETLEALNRFGIKATFFLNGEFIRRHPAAAAEIVNAGHETASMFFAAIDLADVRYRTDLDFITRGLARNEDEFFRITGKELALLWHPPWYTASPSISASAARAGYTTVQRDLDPMDWVGMNEEKTLGLTQKTSSEMVDYILKNCGDGSVIPVRLGLLPGGRNDYLYNRINVLIDALLQAGYTLTTVSDLN